MRVLLICYLLSFVPIFGQEPDLEISIPSVITTKKGVIYEQCKLKRKEPDGLIIEHKGGVAKVSFFDLDKNLQKQFKFDPIAAMEKYKRDQKLQRDMKWQLFWAAEKHKVQVAENDRLIQFHKAVKGKWTPVEARVLSTDATGSFVSAGRITFVPTKTKSTLGLEIDGPLRKTLVPITPNVIFIESPGVKGEIWKGYLEPVAHRTKQYPSEAQQEIPSYRAVARSEIQ